MKKGPRGASVAFPLHTHALPHLVPPATLALYREGRSQSASPSVLLLWGDVSTALHVQSHQGSSPQGCPNPMPLSPGWREGNLCPASPSPTGGHLLSSLPLMIPTPSAPPSRVWLGLCPSHHNHRHCEALLLAVLPPWPALHLGRGHQGQSRPSRAGTTGPSTSTAPGARGWEGAGNCQAQS